MNRILHSLRTAALLPVLALVMAATLVTGQVLKCCRLNEALSATAAQVFHAVTLLGQSHHHEVAHAEEAGHPRCHGHEGAGGFAFSAEGGSPGTAEEPAWLPDDPCLSGFAFAAKGLPTSSPDLVPTLLAFVSARLDIEVLRPARTETSRPRDKSSPPVYLLTLRLLV